MVKQLYYSEILRKTSKSICLSYILARIICNKVHGKTPRLLIVLSAGALLIISRET